MHHTVKQGWKRFLYGGVVLAMLVASMANWPRH